MARFSVMTFMFDSWWQDGRMSLEKMLDGFASLGADGIEVFQVPFAKDDTLLARMRSAADRCGLKIPTVDVICDLVHASKSDREKARKELRQGLNITAALGAEIAHVAGNEPKDDVSLDDARKMIADELAAQADYAASCGLMIAVEDFNPSPDLMCRAEDCLAVLKHADGKVRFVFDTGNFIYAGDDAVKAFDELYDWTCYFHFKDARPADQKKPGDGGEYLGFCGAPMGTGVVPNAEIARKAQSRGYDGWVALEIMAPAEDPIASVRRDLPVLKGWFGQ
jgi:sugar phosphate isomerase/epimerase